MPQLIIEQPGVPPITVPIAEGEVSLGRAEDNDVVLVADEVSRHHAMLSYRAGKGILFDKKSLNGTYVNRQRIVERMLTHMDEVWFGGKCRLVYRDDTFFGAKQMPSQNDSTLAHDLAKIRAEMDQVGTNMTMIVKKGRTPFAAEGDRTMPAQASPDELMAMSRAYRRLEALHRSSKVIASDFDLDNRLGKVLDTAMEVMDAERGFVLLRDDRTSELRVRVARAMGKDLAASSPSMGVAGKAAIDGEPVLMASSATDQQYGVRDSIIQQAIVSAMAVPLRVEDRALGSIYVDTRKIGVSFNEEDLELFASMASQSAMAIDNVRLYERMVEAEKKRANLSRFLSPSVVDEIMKEDTALELGGRKRVVTALFCDIRGFTPLCERMMPAQVVGMLNEHFTAMTEIIFCHRGTLDKYIGDEIMAVFGSPLSFEDDAELAVRAALAIQVKNAELNALRAQENRPVLHLGIGVNTGEAIAGFIGSPMRMEFTVIGDRVNTARRLCDLAKAGQVIVGGTTFAHVKDKADARPVGSVMLEGKAVPVDVYEILAIR